MTAAPGQPPKAKKAKKEKPALEELPADGHPGNSKFARALGSVDYQTREKGVQALKSWMVRKQDLKESDMMKIWKGLFYCFWHSDKAPVQADLAERLAAMLTQLSEESAYLFFTCFVTTMRREWFGIDRLRLDKFLMLVRKFINKMLMCLKAAKWRPDLVQRYASYLQHHVLLPGDTVPAAGLGYHCGDVLLDELREVAGDRPVPAEALATLLAPFSAALQAGEQPTLHRLGEGFFDSLLSELGKPTDDSPYLQLLDTAALASNLFELGAAADTRARNRQVLYDLSNALERLQRKRQRIDTGAQAGPSSDGTAVAGKAKKQSKKSRAGAADADAAADVEAPAATVNGDSNVAAAAASIRGRKKLKAAAAEPAGAEEAAATPVEPEPVGLDKLAQPKQKSLRKKQKQDSNLAEPSETSPAAAAAAVAAPAAVGAAATKAAAQASPKEHVAANGVAHREPTSGQKAAFRAAVAKLGQAAEVKPAKATKAKQPADAPHQANGHASAGTPNGAPADGKPSALGKRAAPGSGGKVAGQAVDKGGEHEDEAPASKTPAQAGTGAAGRKRAVTTAKKGRVVINLKKNLYFEHGGPIPDPDIRTPPTARAKGGILKKTAKTCPPKMTATSAAQAAAKQQLHKAGEKQLPRVLPKTARRASAALFF